MGRINLQSLIDDVLSMAKDSQNIRKKKTEDVQPSWYGGNKDEAEYWKDIRARNTDIERQGLINRGQADVATINDVGATARQKLVGQSQENVANITAGAHRYGHQLQSDATKYTADQHVKAAGFKDGQSGDPIRDIIIEGIKSGTIDPTNMEAMNAAIGNARRLTAKPAEISDKYFTESPAALPPSSPGAAPITSREPGAQRMPGQPSVMDIDREITEENKKKKYVDNRFGNWAIKRAKNIGTAGPRAVGAGMEKIRRIGNRIAESKIWDE